MILANFLRLSWRLFRLFIHLIWAIILAIIVINPMGERIQVGQSNLKSLAIVHWSRVFCRIFGLRVKFYGTTQEPPCLLVANHLTWLDIQIVHTIYPAHFVAKQEIANWPIFGWLAKCAGTIFHQRGNHGSLSTVQDQLINRLNNRHYVLIFPEGTTGNGHELKTFHARLFKVAIAAKTSVQPIAIYYKINNKSANAQVAFTPGESLISSFFRLIKHKKIWVEIHLTKLINTENQNRKTIAEQAKMQITQCLTNTSNSNEIN